MPRKSKAPDYQISIEPVGFPTYVMEGSVAKLNDAKSVAAQMFLTQLGTPIRTIAIIQDRKIVDVFDGSWSSDYQLQDESE